MSFEKIKFKEIINGEEIQYLINDKYVTKETYFSLLNDESLYVLPPLPKMNGSPENSYNVDKTSNVNNKNNDEGICACEECQELLEIIYDIREMNDNEALEGLRNYIDAIRTKTNLESLIQAYSEFGNSMIKVSAQLEVELEDFLSQFDVIDEDT